jgi:MEMO1 family protein
MSYKNSKLECFMNSRPPVVSGQFYSANKDELSTVVDKYISTSKNFCFVPKIVVSPHAGFVYSGPTAGYAYRQLENLEDKEYTVLLVGPSHRIYFEGFSFPLYDSFETPLGSIKVNQTKISQFLSSQENQELFFRHDAPHADEHSLETQLPFLQRSMKKFNIIPIVYGKSDYNVLAKVFDYFLADADTIAVVSSDLSHYHGYQEAMQIDKNCNEAVLALDAISIASGEACGMIGVQAAIVYAKKHSLESLVLDYKTSGDTAGDKIKVVGYASYMFYKR